MDIFRWTVIFEMVPKPLPPPSVPLSKNLNISLLYQLHLPPLQQLSPAPPMCGECLFVVDVLGHR